MDSFRGVEDEGAAPAVIEEEPAMDRPPEIGVDERRMHVRAYNYWVSLLGGRAYPSIRDVDPANIEDFGPHSVLLDFSKSQLDPSIAFLGRTLRIECGLDAAIRNISEVPSRSLLSRLTDHYMQIIANCAPIGFEAEFVGQRGHNTVYRGILMPLSSDGEAIDFIYGVINWKELADSETATQIASQAESIAPAPAASVPYGADSPVWADGPHADFGETGLSPEAPADHDNLSLWPDDPALADRLCLARDCALEARDASERSHHALYRALGQAYDFALAADEAPEDYAELLAEEGLKAQARAPMTPVAKLVFGAQYDKTRLTEFAACLSWAKREAVPQGELARRIESEAGGLKAIVAAERAHRRPLPRPDRWADVRAELKTIRPLARVDLAFEGEGDFVLLVARRDGEGLAIVAPVSDEKLIDQAIRRTAA
jgi:hypothetical protein